MKLPRVKKDGRYFLRVFRAEHDLTQTAAAKLFGISPSHWSLMEEGKRLPSPQVAARLAEVTAAPIEVFLNVKVTR